MGRLSLILHFCIVNTTLYVSNCHRNLGLKNLTRLFMSYSKVGGSCYLQKDFKEFQFSPSKLLDLPIEENKDNFIRRNIKGAVFSWVDPTPILAPSLVHYSQDVLAEVMDLDPSVSKSQEFIDFVAGNNVIKSSSPMAHRYGGHQFGYWAMQLGDGRAILLGEYVNSNGQRWELQLKGSGKTPYSRDGDGRAVLRSSIREFLCSEAMHYLGIPTSRAAAIVVGKNKVMRDLLYDGHPMLESTAVVLRIAPSWFRIGSLEILAKHQEKEELTSLVNFVIEEHFPEFSQSENRLIEFFTKVCQTTAELVVMWQAIGFTHGVLNTDNISLLGVTIDYGPFGFMENFDFLYVPNHSDSEARYCYGRQPKVIIYNLVKLAEALSPLLNPDQLNKVNDILQSQVSFINDSLNLTFSKKLGFLEREPELVDKMLMIFSDTKSDLTMTFRQLSETNLSEVYEHIRSWPLDEFSKHDDFNSFIQLYKQRLEENDITETVRKERMCKMNPRYVLRNWMAQDAIKKAETGDYSEVEKLLRVLKTPFTKQEEAEDSGYAFKPPHWAKTLRLSCSS